MIELDDDGQKEHTGEPGKRGTFSTGYSPDDSGDTVAMLSAAIWVGYMDDQCMKEVDRIIGYIRRRPKDYLP